MRPGSKVRLWPSSTRAPGGMRTEDRGPTAVSRSSSHTATASITGSRPVPSMSRSATRAKVRSSRIATSYRASMGSIANTPPRLLRLAHEEEPVEPGQFGRQGRGAADDLLIPEDVEDARTNLLGWGSPANPVVL